MTPESQKLECLIATEDSSAPPMISATRGASSKEDVETVLHGWWQEVLGLEQVDLDDDFFDLGGHSLIGVELFSKIEARYGLNLGLSTLFEARTVRHLAAHIHEASQKTSTVEGPSSCLVAIQPHGSRPPVFWLPGGFGATVLPFKQVSLLLGPDQPVYGFEAKMPEADQELESVPERAANFIKEMRSLQPKGPYSLIGFCSGGYFAYEMAQQLSAAGQEVALLAMVECYDEHYPYGRIGKIRFHVERTAWRIQRVLGRGPMGVGKWAAQRLKSFVQSIPLFAERAQARLAGKPVPRLPSEPEDVYAKVRRSVDRYQLVKYRGKAVVLVAKDSYNFCGLSSSVDPRLVWCKLSEGGCEVRSIPGDHMDLLEAPMAYRFAEELKSCLERFRGSRS